jgi:hypothetical protein
MAPRSGACAPRNGDKAFGSRTTPRVKTGLIEPYPDTRSFPDSRDKKPHKLHLISCDIPRWLTCFHNRLLEVFTNTDLADVAQKRSLIITYLLHRATPRMSIKVRILESAKIGGLVKIIIGELSRHCNKNNPLQDASAGFHY